MSKEKALQNILKAEELLWDSNPLPLVPGKVAEAARLTRYAINELQAMVVLERAAELLESLPSHEERAEIDKALSLIRKAVMHSRAPIRRKTSGGWLLKTNEIAWCSFVQALAAYALRGA